MKENLRLRKELEEARKENLKKSSGILCEGNRLDRNNQIIVAGDEQDSE